MSTRPRTKVQEMKAAQAAAHKRRQRLIWMVGGVVILGLIVAIALVVINASRGGDEPAGVQQVIVPANTAAGAIAVGDPEAPVRMELYYDYMCPACAMFEKTNSSDLDGLIQGGKLSLELRPISFLDPQSQGTKYSTRAANAIATVADGAPESVWEFHRELYANQPREGTEGLSDDQLAEVASEAGVPADVIARFEKGTHQDWVGQVTEEAFASGVSGTPTVKLDGVVFKEDLYAPGVLRAAIEKAAAETASAP